jgi:enoyl-[acyl-carrier protein] reductase I
MSLLDGKRILVTGVLTDASIAFHVARLAQEEGAQVVLSSYGRVLRLTGRIAGRLPKPALPENLRAAGLDGLDGVVHSIGFAPEAALGGNFLDTSWEDVATAVHVSTYSYKALAMAAKSMFPAAGGSIVGLTFDATVAWPKYDWMGIAKAGLESCSRYLAKYLGPDGIRSNLVAAGPIRTMAAKSIPGFDEFENVWTDRAPIGWDLNDPVPAAQACVALLSDWFPATTGEIVHVDGGVHAMGG